MKLFLCLFAVVLLSCPGSSQLAGSGQRARRPYKPEPEPEPYSPYSPAPSCECINPFLGTKRAYRGDPEALCGPRGPGFCYVACNDACRDQKPTATAARSANTTCVYG